MTIQIYYWMELCLTSMPPTHGEWPNQHRPLGVNSNFAIILFLEKNIGGRKIGGGNKENGEKVIFYLFSDAIIQGRRGRVWHPQM